MYSQKFDTLQWLTVTAETELLLVWCLVVYCVQLPVCSIFRLPWLFQFFVCHSPSQSQTSIISLVSLESRSWSWTSKSWSWSWISKSWIQVWLLDRVCRTTYFSVYVTRNILTWSSACYWRRTCFAEDLVTVAFYSPYKSAFTLQLHYTRWHKYIVRFIPRIMSGRKRQSYTVCLKKTSPTFLAVTRESIVGFS